MRMSPRIQSSLHFLTQGTILHEALHNMTGLYDFVGQDERNLYGYQPPYDLKTFVGIEPTPGVESKARYHKRHNDTTEVKGLCRR